jgi:hypothetical protein
MVPSCLEVMSSSPSRGLADEEIGARRRRAHRFRDQIVKRHVHVLAVGFTHK